MRSLGTSECAGELGGRGECRAACVDTTGQARVDFLEEPAVAVRIAERGERAVAAMLEVPTADPKPPEQVWLVRAGMRIAGVVERLADRDTPTEQLGASGLDVGDDEIQPLGGTRYRGGDVLAED